MAEVAPASLIQEFAPEQAHVARLNGLRLLNDHEQAAAKLLALLNRDHKNGLTLRKFSLPSGFDMKELPSRLKTWRASIAKSAGMAPHNVILRRDPGDYYSYFFIAPKRCGIGSVVQDVTPQNSRRLFEITLESLMIARSGLFSERLASIIGPRGKAARLYLQIGAVRKNKKGTKHYLDSLLVETDLDWYGQLVVDTKRRVFSLPVDSAEVAPAVKAVWIADSVVKIALVDLEGVRQVDGRSKQSRLAIPEISFDAKTVRNSRWYAICQLLGQIQAVLRDAQVEFEPMTFKATHFLKNSFLKQNAFSFPDRLVIAYPQSMVLGQPLRATLRRQIAQLLNKDDSALQIEWMSHANLPNSGILRNDLPYLFVNRQASLAYEDDEDLSSTSEFAALDELPDDGTGSCTVNGTPADPEDTFAALASGAVNLNAVDCYTRVKYLNLISSNSIQACFQGVNVIEGLGELQGGHKLRKAIAELLLKWALLQGRYTCFNPLPQARIRATFTRAAKRGLQRGLETLAQVTMNTREESSEVSFSVSRVPPAHLDGVMNAIKALPLLQKGKATDMRSGNPASEPSASISSGLRNDMFVMELLEFEGDIEDDVCLIIYDGSTVRIPRIIGAMANPLLHEHLDELIGSLPDDKKGTLPRGAKRGAPNLLPYYIEGFEGQRGREYLYVDARSDRYLRYFVPQVTAPNSTIGFARFYDMMLYKKNDRKRERPLLITVNHPTVQVFLSMMTQDVIRLGENSRHTLVRKLAALAALN